MILPVSHPVGLFLRSAALALCFAPTAALADKISHPTAVFAGLDKITGRIIAFDVSIDETVQFGSLQITPRACYTRPQTEAPLTLGFTEVEEVQSDNQFKRIFSGWMFAASPGLHGVEHPVYDVWLTDCKGGTEIIHDAVAGLPQEDINNPPPPPKPGTQPRQRQQARPATPNGGPTPQPLPAGAPLPGATVPGQPLPPPGAPQPQRQAQPLPGTPGGQPLPRRDPNAPIPPGEVGQAQGRRTPSQTFFPTASEPGLR